MEPDHLPAGWYPDPTDAARRRYWDGSRWAALTQPPSFAIRPSSLDDEPVGSPRNPIGAGSSALAAALTALTATALTEPRPAPEPPVERRSRLRFRSRAG